MTNRKGRTHNRPAFSVSGSPKSAGHYFSFLSLFIFFITELVFKEHGVILGGDQVRKGLLEGIDEAFQFMIHDIV